MYVSTSCTLNRLAPQCAMCIHVVVHTCGIGNTVYMYSYVCMYVLPFVDSTMKDWIYILSFFRGCKEFEEEVRLGRTLLFLGD